MDKPVVDKPAPKFKQICVGQYTYHGSNSFSVIGLDEEGHVWQFKRSGWTRLEEVGGSPPRQKIEPREPGQEPGW